MRSVGQFSCGPRLGARQPLGGCPGLFPDGGLDARRRRLRQSDRTDAASADLATNRAARTSRSRCRSAARAAVKVARDPWRTAGRVYRHRGAAGHTGRPAGGLFLAPPASPRRPGRAAPGSQGHKPRHRARSDRRDQRIAADRPLDPARTARPPSECKWRAPRRLSRRTPAPKAPAAGGRIRIRGPSGRAERQDADAASLWAGKRIGSGSAGWSAASGPMLWTRRSAR